MAYVLDTNICIQFMDVHPPQVVERFRATPVGEVMISVVTYAELRHGVERTPVADRAAAESALRRLVALLPVLPFEEKAAGRYGVLRAAVLDRLIAAHAL